MKKSTKQYPQKNFRVSGQALANLEQICETVGCTQTAAVEMALARLAVELTRAQPVTISDNSKNILIRP